MTFPVGVYWPWALRTVAASDMDVDVVAVPGVAVDVTVSTVAMLTSLLSCTGVPPSGVKVATTGMVPAATGIQVTSALLPSVPPTFCEPIAVPEAVNVTVPEGLPIASDDTVAETVCDTPTVPLSTVSATDSCALAGAATPTKPPSPNAAAMANTVNLMRFRGVGAWSCTVSPHAVIGFRRPAQ